MTTRWNKPAEFIEDLEDGTEVRASVRPAEGPYTAAARLLIQGTDKEKWSHTDLVAGATYRTAQGQAALIHFFILFFGDATVDIDVSFVAPSGATTEGGWTISGHRGDEVERKLFLSPAP